MMKALMLPAFASGMLLLAGCHKPSPTTTMTAPFQMTDWGVIEVVASTPKHLKLEGRDCTLTATPLADGKFAVVIETDSTDASDTPPGLPPGTSVHTRSKSNMTLPGNVECMCSVGHKPVRFTLRLKAS
jgi:hypothetical protein